MFLWMDIYRELYCMCFFRKKEGNFSASNKDLWALTLVGPARESLVLDPLAVQHIDIQIYIICDLNAQNKH